MAPSLVSDLSRSGEALTPTFVFSDATPFTAGASLTYTVQVSTLDDFSNVVDSESDILAGAGNVGAGQTGWTITRELTDGTTYYWRVRAVEGSLIGNWTATQEFIAQAVVLEGDFNGDLAVDLDDFFEFANNFGQSATGDAAKFDLDGDGQVDLDDFFRFANNFGTSVAGKPWAFAHFLDEQAHIRLEASGGSRADEGGRTHAPIAVRVDATGVEEMTAFGLVIGYDPTAVRFERAGAGHLLESQGGEAPFFQVFRHTPGLIVIGNGLASGEPVSGHGPLAELVFVTTTTGPTNDAFFDLRDAVIARDDGTVHRVARLVAAQLRPAEFRLGANFPNPFNPTTSIDYDVPQAAPVELVIYDVLGQKVKTLVDDGDHHAGFHTAVWDGTDAHNRPVGNGLYFYRLTADRFHSVGKMMLLK